jgi:hypothetical protein
VAGRGVSRVSTRSRFVSTTQEDFF